MKLGESSGAQIQYTLHLEGSGAIVNENLLSQRCNDEGTQTNIRDKASDWNRTQPGYPGGGFDKYTQGDLLKQLLVLAVPWLPPWPSFLQPDLYASRENVTVEVWGWPLATHLLPLGHCVSPHPFQGFGNTTHHPLTGCTGIAHSVSSKAGPLLLGLAVPFSGSHSLP